LKLDEDIRTPAAHVLPDRPPSRAERSRAATRAKLLAAAGRVMAEKGVEAISITDITAAADVGTGSFYNHFSSKTEIAELIFLQHADDLARVNAVVSREEPPPAVAVSHILKIFLTKAVADPLWGWFVVQTSSDLPRMSEVFAHHSAADIARAGALGRFHVADIDVAVRIILAALIVTMRALLDRRMQPDGIEAVVQALLQMLGMPHGEAAQISRIPLPAYVEDILDNAARSP
jgi:AcrR family transcriptional regulator